MRDAKHIQKYRHDLEELPRESIVRTAVDLEIGVQKEVAVALLRKKIAIGGSQSAGGASASGSLANPTLNRRVRQLQGHE